MSRGPFRERQPFLQTQEDPTIARPREQAEQRSAREKLFQIIDDRIEAHYLSEGKQYTPAEEKWLREEAIRAIHRGKPASFSRKSVEPTQDANDDVFQSPAPDAPLLRLEARHQAFIDTQPGDAPWSTDSFDDELLTKEAPQRWEDLPAKLRQEAEDGVLIYIMLIAKSRRIPLSRAVTSLLSLEGNIAQQYEESAAETILDICQTFDIPCTKVEAVSIYYGILDEFRKDKGGGI